MWLWNACEASAICVGAAAAVAANVVASGYTWFVAQTFTAWIYDPLPHVGFGLWY